MGDLSSPEKSVNPGDESNEGESGNAISLVSVNTDAINALNAALNGVQLLGEVVMHIQQAASAVDTASSNGVVTINEHVKGIKPDIDKLAVEAVTRAIQANNRLKELLDTFMSAVRLGG